MDKPLPFKVQAYGAIYATFNSLSDAEEYAQFQSAKLTAGWHEVRSNSDDFLYVAFLAGEEVKREYA